MTKSMDKNGMQTVKGGQIGPHTSASTQSAAPAFIYVAPKTIPLPVLVAVPHAGRAYPSNVLSCLRDVAMAERRLEDRHIDLVGVEIAKATGTGLLVAHAPRAMIDLNRSDDDVDWDMISGVEKPSSKQKSMPKGQNSRARSGLGLVPRRLPGFGEIWRQKLPAAELARRVTSIHRPYHTFLAQELQRIRDAWGAVLLIDLHSMPPLRRPSGELRAPEIVIGDRFGASSDSSLVSSAFRYLDQQGVVSAHNRPYSGGYVLDRHAAPMRGIHGLQLEVCRSTYLDASLSEPTEAVRPLGKMLAGLVRELGATTAALAASGRSMQAAE